MKKYDYLIVGAGLYGAVFAHEAASKGKSVLVVEKRSHIGGNVYTEKVEGFPCTNTVPTFFIPTTKKFGIM